jgi:multiple sugar transport system ATP-binding protein
VRVSTIQSGHWTPVTVYVTELMGNETFVIVQTGSQKIIARIPGGFRADSGRSAWISFDLTKAHLFDAETGRRL